MDEQHDFDHQDNAELPGPRDIASWLERITRRSLGDVRIHDSAQAGELARRLGARAFTAGRDVYVRPELVNPMTTEGAALLAHELFHAAEQSGGDTIQEASMPLLRPLPTPQAGSSPSSSRRTGTASIPSQASVGGQVGGTAVQRQAAPLQRASAGLSGSETTAETVASAATQATRPKRKRARPAPLDPEIIADLVYHQMVQQLLLDKERGAY